MKVHPNTAEIHSSTKLRNIQIHLESMDTHSDSGKAWCEGYICGLAFAGHITMMEEELLLEWLVSMYGAKK